MTLDEYQQETKRTAGNRTLEDGLVMGGLGIAGEAGEVADIIKKWKFHGHVLDRQALQKELGDVLWYVAAIAGHAGISLRDVAIVNLAKLRQRYPNGFSVEASVNRTE